MTSGKKLKRGGGVTTRLITNPKEEGVNPPREALDPLKIYLNLRKFLETEKPAWLNSLIENCRTLKTIPSMAEFFGSDSEFLDSRIKTQIKTRKISLFELKFLLFCGEIFFLIRQTEKKIRNPKEFLEKDAAAGLILQYADRFLTSTKENFRFLPIFFDSDEFLSIFSILVAWEIFDLCGVCAK